MTSKSRSNRRLSGGLAALPLALLAASAPASAETVQLTITYSAKLTGIPVGKAKIEAQLNGDDYSISGSGKVAGITALFADGKGNVSVSGILRDQLFQPTRYSQTIIDDEKKSVDMTFDGARVADVTFTPPPKEKDENRKKKKKKKQRAEPIPLTDEHKVGVIDPLSVFLLAAADMSGPGICNRTLPVFDGEERFDVVLTFEKQVKRGNQDAFICRAAYRPIAGHRPDKDTVKFMAANKDMSVWLAPVGTTGFVAPVEAHVRTQYGMLVIRADKFNVNQ